eukprot:gene32687-biopygen17503
MTHDSMAPASTSLSYVAYAQRVAADVSIAVYVVICLMITAVGVGGYCIPGNVKQSRRIIFKTLFKYGGIFLKCRDLSRVTIKVPNLMVMVQLAEALHKHPQLRVWRCKNRFSAKERGNAQDSGGYLDFQMVCLFELNGRYHYVEVQLNLIEMVAIKAGGGGGGGHDAFNTARVIDAFSRRSTEYRGNPSAELWAMISAGTVQRVILDGAKITVDDAAQLEKAMESKLCRVETMSLKGCFPKTMPFLSLWFKQTELIGVADLDFSDWTGLTTLPEELSKLVNLQSLDLSGCTSLAKVPDLSQLLPKLKIKNVPKHLSNWEKQGFVAFDFTDAANVAKTTTLAFSEFQGSELPEWLSKLVNLQSLDLIHCVNLTTLPEGMSKLVNLQSLELNRCGNPPGNLTTLPECLSELVNLQSLNLYNCQNLTTLPDVSKLVNLQSLNLEHCEKLTTLPEGMSKLVNLQSLNLSFCRILTTLPEGMSKLVNLQYLNLSICYGLTTLPEGLSKLVNLQSLDLWRCVYLTILPDLSHLLPALKVKNVNSASAAAQAWEGRGFTAQ